MTDSFILRTATSPRAMKLEFDFTGDRFAHRLALESGPAAALGQVDRPPGDRSLCMSVEGTSAEDWPASPAIQEVSFEEIGGKQVALATGQAGCSYWSASIAALTSSPDVESLGFEFDVAVRTRLPVEDLGSTYRFSESLRLSRCTESEWIYDGIDDPTANRQSTALTVRVLSGYGEVGADGHLSIRPTLPTPSPSTAMLTLRWHYSIVVS